MALVSTLLAECGGNTSASIRVAIRTLSGPTVNLGPADISQLLDVTFNLLSSGRVHDRVSFWNLVPIVSRSDYLAVAVTHLAQVASKIHLYVQTAKNQDERKAMCIGLQAILEIEQFYEPITSKLESIFPKLMTTVLKLIRMGGSSAVDCEFGLQVLLTLCKHRGRAVNVSHGGAITGACVAILMLRSQVTATDRIEQTDCQLSYEVRSLAATVLALHTSFGSPEQYENVWVNLTQEYSNVLSTLGLLRRPASPSSFSKPKTAISGSTSSAKHLHGRGSGLAMQLEAIFQGLSLALCELLWYGCSSGPVSLDLSTHLATSLGTAVCHRVDVKPSDPKFGIPNAESIAPAHVVLVSSQIRVHAVTLLATLLRHTQPSTSPSPLLGVCCTCLSSIFNMSSDTVTMQYSSTPAVHAVATVGLSCFQSALRLFPTVVLQRCSGVVQCIVSMFSKAMACETASRSIDSITSSAITTGTSLSRSGAGALKANTVTSTHGVCNMTVRCALDVCDLMYAVEMILHLAAPLIHSDTRQDIEYTVAVGLKCAAKGVMEPDSYQLSQSAAKDTLLSLASSAAGGNGSATARPQKRMRRAACEPLRTNTLLLNALLRLAQAEVSAPFPDGSRSGNLPMLKQFVSVCVGIDALTVEAVRASRYVEAVLFPVASNIPGIPVGPVAVDSYPIDSYSISQAESAIVSHLNVGTSAGATGRSSHLGSRVEAGDSGAVGGDSMEQGHDSHSAHMLEGNTICKKSGKNDDSSSGGISSTSAPSWRKRLHPSSVSSGESDTIAPSTAIDDGVTHTRQKSTSSSAARSESTSWSGQVPSAGADGEDNDSDDDLPDLDVEADPDQN